MKCTCKKCQDLSNWIEQVYDHPKVVGKARELNVDDYLDLINETAVQILKGCRGLHFESIHQVIQYFRVTMVRSVYSRGQKRALIKDYKRRSRTFPIEDFYHLHDPIDEHARRLGELDFQTMKDLIKKPSWKELIRLYYEEGYLIREIAAMQGKNENTLYMHHQQILEELRCKLNLQKIH
jgi:DNA-directed RNA polymerase specialized sigma24 family protein